MYNITMCSKIATINNADTRFVDTKTKAYIVQFKSNRTMLNVNLKKPTCKSQAKINFLLV